MEDKWLSVDEITQYLGVSRDTVYSWIQTRDMPAHRVGRLWKFKKEAVDRWIESGGADPNVRPRKKAGLRAAVNEFRNTGRPKKKG